MRLWLLAQCMGFGMTGMDCCYGWRMTVWFLGVCLLLPTFALLTAQVGATELHLEQPGL